MKFTLDRSRIYLVCLYFSMSFFYLSFVLGEQDPVPLLGYILALIIFIILSHDALLRIISESTGRSDDLDEAGSFAELLELNSRIQQSLDLSEVMLPVVNWLQARMKADKVLCLVAAELGGGSNDEAALEYWPAAPASTTHSAALLGGLTGRKDVLSYRQADGLLLELFRKTGTRVLLPVVHDGHMLCVFLLGGQGEARDFSPFECQLLSFLASQLALALDRIRVYRKVMHKAELDHEEKLQVMRSLSANIAHEMRTPLSGIRASMEGCEEYLPQLMEGYEYSAEMFPDRFPPIREDHRNSIVATPRRIQLMIDQANNVIDMLLMNLRESALDQNKLHVIDARRMIEQAIDRYPFRTGERKKVQLQLRENFSFAGVESLCIYIMFNLLKNALYSLHAARKGEVSVILQCGADSNNILFKDTGLGIEPEILERVFDGFFTTKSDGTGAGLTFCRRTVESFGGRMICVAEAGSFAEFRMEFPILEENA